MHYIFHVRHWNVAFFIQLREHLLSISPENKVSSWTMEQEALSYDKTNKLNLLYLPDLLAGIGDEVENDEIEAFEHYLQNTFGFGIPFLYDIERYRPADYKGSEFVHKHLAFFLKHITPQSILVSLTMDHFVYILSGFINQFKSGRNYFIQPIGFPLQAQIIMENPWNVHNIWPEGLPIGKLEQYIDSLQLDPKQSVHYMKPQALLSMSKAIKGKVAAVFKSKDNSVFGYLNPRSQKSLVPQRFRKNKVNYRVELPDLESLERIATKSKVFYFPLQLEPEMSILAYSPWFKNQFDIIRLISQSLGVNDILVIKENPKMVNGRGESFYKEVSRFSNVKWIDPAVNSREIIRRSSKVISISGTATIEAACLGINSIMFGQPPFSPLLMGLPVSEMPLSNLSKTLYDSYPPEAIKNKVYKEWSEFSKAVFFGNFTPKYIDEQYTLEQAEELAENFVKIISTPNA